MPPLVIQAGTIIDSALLVERGMKTIFLGYKKDTFHTEGFVVTAHLPAMSGSDSADVIVW